MREESSTTCGPTAVLTNVDDTEAEVHDVAVGDPR
jgi:hypothetical protein